ncbi:MAG: cytochrome c [Acidimicrobiia bacterium]|nr:cytochrome c [Acidimicrobiia bacterium]
MNHPTGRRTEEAHSRGRVGPVWRTLGVLVILGVALAGCGDDSSGGGNDTAPPPTGDQADDQALVAGQEIFQSSCATCHGLTGDGGQGPKLSDGSVADRYPDIEDQIAVVSGGRGQMPSFQGELSDEEIENVVRYEREVL